MKLKILLPVFIILLFSGCKSNEEAVMNLRSISFTSDITYYNENYSADCIIDSDGNFTALLTQPQSIAGLLLEYVGGECKIKYNGIEIKNSGSMLPANCSVDVIYNILNDCENTLHSADNGNIEARGEYGGHKYLLSASPGGLPISLEIPDMGITVSFKNVSYIK